MGNKADAYRQVAISTGNIICRDAVWHDGACNWTGLAIDSAGGRRIYSRALPSDFYDGVAGIAFFLLQLYKAEPGPILLKTINGALQQLVRYSDREGNELNGFFNGRAGIVYSLTEGAELLNDKEMAAVARRKRKELLLQAKEDTNTDIICGLAGIILFLLHEVNNKKNREEFHSVVVLLGERLIKLADKCERGYSWKTLEGYSQNLTGFAHGASGIGYAFMELYAATKQERFLTAAREAFRYEDSFFNKQKQNWPDFRFTDSAKQEAEQVCGMAWCHGAPGIGLARLRAYEITGDKSFLQAAENAAEITVTQFNRQSINDYSLCHGLTGNAFFLLKAAKIFKKKNYQEAVIQMANKCLEKYFIRDIPLPNGYLTDRESPCFMQGSSGIGYFFLKLYESANKNSLQLFPGMIG